MEIDTFIQMLSVIPQDQDKAMTRVEICTTYYKVFANENTPPIRKASRQRKVDRWIGDMWDIGLLRAKNNDHGVPNCRYHLSNERVLGYLLNGSVALRLLWASKVLDPFREIDGKNPTNGFENNARLNQRELTLRDRVRIVPDGVGRLPARIGENTMTAVVDALVEGQQISINYHPPKGEDIEVMVTILGLVAKDGAIYLVGCQGFDDIPRHYAMHRILSAQYSNNRAVSRPEFNIDKYIEDQHQFAHVYRNEEAPIKLVLKVHKDALFHFKERPFNADQNISKTGDQDGWFDVVATVPYTIMLAPFLWSHAGWVKVIGPESIRKRVVDGIRAAAENYDIAKKE